MTHLRLGDEVPVHLRKGGVSVLTGRDTAGAGAKFGGDGGRADGFGPAAFILLRSAEGMLFLNNCENELAELLKNKVVEGAGLARHGEG